jgi:uncharacterized coiled-coil protein SlyX
MSDFRAIEKINRWSASDDIALSKFVREGEKLGARNLPEPFATTLSALEQEELSKCQSALRDLSGEVSTFRSNTQDQIEVIAQELDAELPAKQSEILDKYEAEIESVEAELGPKSANLENTTTKLEEAKSNLALVKQSLGNRELQTHFAGFYWPFMGCLALAEVSVNRLAFELFFEGSPLASMLLAVAVGVMLVFFAHISGVAIKRAIPKSSSENAGTIFSMLLLNGLIAVFILYLAKMRQAFVSITSEQGESLVDMFNTEEGKILGSDINDAGTLESLISTNIGQEGFFLLLVNVVVYVAGAVAALLRHDTHPDYEKLEKQVAKLTERSVLLKKRYQSKHSEVTKRRQERMAEVKSKISQSQRELKRLESALRKSEDIVEKSGQKLEAALRNKVRAFRDANVAARNVAPPKYFKQKVTINS